MDNIKIFVLTLLLFLGEFVFAQKKSEVQWHNPANETVRVVHNQLWSGEEIQHLYDRLPAKAEPLVRAAVWRLSRAGAGLKLVFNTNAKTVTVRYVTIKNRTNYGSPHFPATGYSGVDLFAENNDGSWAWANGSRSFKDTVTYTFKNLVLDKDKYPGGRNFHLYLPLYNNAEWLEIGVDAGSTFEFIPVSDEKPIVVYGTSIAQGASASRPGMAWSNILERKLHTPVVNLGFSGNGRLEKELIDLMVEKEAQMYIIDCLPNLGGDSKNINAKIIYAVNTIRGKYPHVPIILVDHSAFLENRMNSSRARGLRNINKLSFDTYKELQSKGVKHLFYLTQEEIGLDMNDSVDGVHTTDMGMLKYANAYEKLIRSIWKK